MNKLLLLGLIYLGFSCSNNGQDFRSQNLSIEERVSILFKIDRGGSFLLSKQDEALFLRAIPNTFEEYKRFYLKPWVLNGDKIYLSGERHFSSILMCLESISKRKKIGILIKIAMGGDWDADDISYFQNLVQIQIASEIQISTELMGNLLGEEVRSFWHFYFDGPHPENLQSEYNQLYDRVSKIDQGVANLMKESYQTLLEQSDH